MKYLYKQDNKRKYSIYVFNNEHDYERINSLYLTQEEVKAELHELVKPGTYLNKTYGHYKYKLGLNEFVRGRPIQVMIKDYLVTEKIKEENQKKNLTR